MTTTTEVVTYEEKLGALSVTDVRAQVNLIQHIMKEVMQGPTKEHPDGVHYGVIPGTPRPTLLKAGAEKLCLTFRLDPQYEITETKEGSHLTVVSKCTLFHIPSGQRYGSGMGSCSTKESKYAYRQASIKCPACGKDAIIKGKDFKGDGRPTGWICFAKKGGCGVKFQDGDQAIEGQPRGRVPNEDLPDQYNTVLKMANKRSLVAAVLNATAASDIFTQDIEDMPQFTAKVIKDDDEDDTQRIQGVGKYSENATPQAIPPAAAPPASAPAAVASRITLEQAIELAGQLHHCDPKAEADFCRIAKIAQLDHLPAGDYFEALDWIARREAKKAKSA